MKPTFFVFLFILIFLFSYLLISLLPYNLTTNSARAQTITVSATVDAHLSYRQDGNNLIISTNKPEGFTLITEQETITKKGPIVLTVPAAKSFILVSGY